MKSFIVGSMDLDPGALIQCPKCRHTYPAGRETCIYCGAPLGGVRPLAEPILCPKCGLASEKGKLECPFCGVVFSKYRPRRRGQRGHSEKKGRDRWWEDLDLPDFGRIGSRSNENNTEGETAPDAQCEVEAEGPGGGTGEHCFDSGHYEDGGGGSGSFDFFDPDDD